MKYYISDLHIGCQNDYDSRTLEHDDLLEKRWNATITNADDVYILGDIGKTGSRKDNDYLIKRIAVLKGRKHLIVGNHDDLRDNRLAQLFVEITPYAELRDNIGGKSYRLVLSHYPVFAWNNQHKGAILLYGHTHSSVEDGLFQMSLGMLNEYFQYQTDEGRTDCPQCNAYNVGAMKPYIDYCPRTICQITEGRDGYGEKEKEKEEIPLLY